EEPMNIQLNFINNSNDANNSEIVIFQKNVATNFDELAVAWQVIRYCGQGDNHPFTFPMTMQVGASSKEVQVLNSLPVGAINASIYKAGKLLAVKTSIAPQQKAVFEFKPTI